MKEIYTINGHLKDNRKRATGSWLFNGDIEIQDDGRLLYIIDTQEGEKSRFVDEMHKDIQNFIKENMRLKIK